jgi:hypothetical protein
MLSNSALALAFLPLTLAHFQLNFPKSRGFTDDTENNFPCGGYNDVQQERTDFPISGGPIQLHMEHPQTNVAVYMAIGDNPGDGFSIVAQQQTQVSGLGDFCFGHVSLPEGLNVTDGTKASIQVVTNNHEAGGLYQVSFPCYRSHGLSRVANSHTVCGRDPGQHCRDRLRRQLQEPDKHESYSGKHPWQPQRNRDGDNSKLGQRKCRIVHSYYWCRSTSEGYLVGIGCCRSGWNRAALDRSKRVEVERKYLHPSAVVLSGRLPFAVIWSTCS